jgi:hypothetical protein
MDGRRCPGIDPGIREGLEDGTLGGEAIQMPPPRCGCMVLLALTIRPAVWIWLETFVTMLLLVDLYRTHNIGQAAHEVSGGRV